VFETGTSKTRRVNIMISETLIEWASRTAETRGISVSALVREALERERGQSREQAIAEAAESLAALYRSDENLSAFRALDGDDFA
jgi:post-segregation antitoxin (ccd killing protein)